MSIAWTGTPRPPSKQHQLLCSYDYLPPYGVTTSATTSTSSCNTTSSATTAGVLLCSNGYLLPWVSANMSGQAITMKNCVVSAPFAII